MAVARRAATGFGRATHRGERSGVVYSGVYSEPYGRVLEPRELCLLFCIVAEVVKGHMFFMLSESCSFCVLRLVSRREAEACRFVEPLRATDVDHLVGGRPHWVYPTVASCGG